MRLFEFLTLLLQATGQILQDLATLFGENVLVQLLEDNPKHPGEAKMRFQLDPQWFDPAPETTLNKNDGSAYLVIEEAVKKIGLSSILEFHLWSYPFYRILIESSIDLRSEIKNGNPIIGKLLIQEALEQSEKWIYPICQAAEFTQQVEPILMAAGLRFRSEVLKKMGVDYLTAIT